MAENFSRPKVGCRKNKGMGAAEENVRATVQLVDFRTLFWYTLFDLSVSRLSKYEAAPYH